MTFIPPRRLPQLPLHPIENTRRDQRAKRETDQVPGVEYAYPHAEFFAGVPFGEVVQRAGEECGLDEAEEEAREEGTDEALFFYAWV